MSVHGLTKILVTLLSEGIYIKGKEKKKLMQVSTLVEDIKKEMFACNIIVMEKQ